MTGLHAQPMILVADVEAASRWYQALLGVASGHGGPEYERLMAGDALVLQLHALGADHHHGPMARRDVPLGNGVAIWFGTDDLDGMAARARDLGAEVETDVHPNPNNPGVRELWLRDPDGYRVVLADWP